jgi:hypothetical protein
MFIAAEPMIYQCCSVWTDRCAVNLQDTDWHHKCSCYLTGTVYLLSCRVGNLSDVLRVWINIGPNDNNGRAPLVRQVVNKLYNGTNGHVKILSIGCLFIHWPPTDKNNGRGQNVRLCSCHCPTCLKLVRVVDYVHKMPLGTSEQHILISV